MEINILNFLSKSIYNDIFSLNNISSHGVAYKNEREDASDDYTYGLIIVNTFQDIDLDKSNIKNKPKKKYFIYLMILKVIIIL